MARKRRRRYRNWNETFKIPACVYAKRWLKTVAFAVCGGCGKQHKFKIEADWWVSEPATCPKTGLRLVAIRRET